MKLSSTMSSSSLPYSNLSGCSFLAAYLKKKLRICSNFILEDTSFYFPKHFSLRDFSAKKAKQLAKSISDPFSTFPINVRISSSLRYTYLIRFSFRLTIRFSLTSSHSCWLRSVAGYWCCCSSSPSFSNILDCRSNTETVSSLSTYPSFIFLSAALILRSRFSSYWHS